MKIFLTKAANDFITEVTRLCDGEVGGMGYCKLADDNRTIIVDHVFLIPQEVSTGSVDFDDDAIAIACEKAYEEGRIEDLRFSWHSHGRLQTFWSNTDDDGIRKYLSGGTPWLVSLVTNHDEDHLGRIDVAEVPIAGIAEFRAVTVQVEHIDPTNGRAQAEIDKYVRERKFTPWKGSTNFQRKFGPPIKRDELGTKTPKSIHEMDPEEYREWVMGERAPDYMGIGDGDFLGDVFTG